MSKNILEALGKIDLALGGQTDDAVNVIDALNQISDSVGALKTSVDDINSMEIKILSDGEYNSETGVPTVENPVKGTFYLTPAKNEEDNNIFNEYYVNDDGQWEMFGGASINVNDLFDLSDRMAKGVDNDGNIVNGAIVEGMISGSSKNKASGSYSHAEGLSTTASGNQSHAEGAGTKASGSQSHAEGGHTTTSGLNSHAEGGGTTASGTNSHAEGYSTTASGNYSHAEGGSTTASGGCSHAEGRSNNFSSKIVNNVTYTQAGAYGESSHSEGQNTLAIGSYSHAEGAGTIASGGNSHAEGNSTKASGYQSHAEGIGTTASGDNSHAEGMKTIANHKSQHVFGEFNIEDSSTATVDKRGNYVEIVGNGTSTDAKSNARTLDWNGNETLAGSLTLGKGTADEVTITAAQLKALLATLSS